MCVPTLMNHNLHKQSTIEAWAKSNCVSLPTFLLACLLSCLSACLPACLLKTRSFSFGPLIFHKQLLASHSWLESNYYSTRSPSAFIFPSLYSITNLRVRLILKRRWRKCSSDLIPVKRFIHRLIFYDNLESRKKQRDVFAIIESQLSKRKNEKKKVQMGSTSSAIIAGLCTAAVK